ncbi:hypothetical protein ELH94_22565 [Rhizobium leguminosarum]|uniref:M48 family metalloprotease n=1 Tax=Rhizobium leguminosarum TaxID=384 RepID=UPI00102FE874|nr:M48 family metalloprotease [Rhizobium leguminosarum]TAX99114.1 hypothetical protein ELH94_22565 [Rhizobium leguminosarum]
MKFLDCDLVRYAEAYQEDGTHQPPLPKGEYIAYNSVWIRQVAGKDETQLYAILGHELGHFLGRHFSRPINSHDAELEADAFAGCAVGHIHGDWDSFESLLRRLRGDTAGDYPSADESVEAGLKSFEACGGDRPMPLLPENDPAAQSGKESTDDAGNQDTDGAISDAETDASTAAASETYKGWLYIGFYDGNWDDPTLSEINGIAPEDLEGMKFKLARGSNLRDGPFKATIQLPNGGCKHRESKVIGGLPAETDVTVVKVYRLEGKGCSRFVWGQVSPS